jgi:clan AA aspartic protease (TIGR02281 family)
MFRVLLILFFLLSCHAYADDSDIVKADRQALEEAKVSGAFTKILAAKEQLSDDLGMEADQKRKDEEGFTIPLTPDGQGHFLADVLINGGVHASLVVDTGSPVVMLTTAFIQRLGLDLTQANTGYVELLNGKYKAAEVNLDSLRVGDARAQDVGAAVLMEDSKEISDGLLGMTFLSKFHFTLDEKGQKLILRRIE